MKSYLQALSAASLAVLTFGSVAFATVDVTLPAPKTVYSEADALTAAAKLDMGCNEGMAPTVERFGISFKYSYETASDPTRIQEYFIVTCAAGAYNENSVMLRINEYDTELRAVSFAAPMINRSGKIVGYTADVVTGYLSFDPKTETVTSFSKGRGIGDLYVSGTYQLIETDVVLREYTIDNTPGDSKVVPPIFKSKEPFTR